MLDVGEELVDQHLRHIPCDTVLPAQPMLEQEHHQRHHFETPQRRIWNEPLRIKHRLPRRRHDSLIKRLGDGPVGLGFTAEQTLEHEGGLRSP